MHTQTYKCREHTVTFSFKESDSFLGNIVFISPYFDYGIVREPITSCTLREKEFYVGKNGWSEVDPPNDNIFDEVSSRNFHLKFSGNICVLNVLKDGIRLELYMTRSK